MSQIKYLFAYKMRNACFVGAFLLLIGAFIENPFYLIGTLILIPFGIFFHKKRNKYLGV